MNLWDRGGSIRAGLSASNGAPARTLSSSFAPDSGKLGGGSRGTPRTKPGPCHALGPSVRPWPQRIP